MIFDLKKSCKQLELSAEIPVGDAPVMACTVLDRRLQYVMYLPIKTDTHAKKIIEVVKNLSIIVLLFL